MKLKYDFVVQEVADGFVAVAVGRDCEKFSGLIRMNKTSAFVFDQLRNEVTEDELVRRMYEKYDAEEDVLRDNVRSFTKTLYDEGLLSM